MESARATAAEFGVPEAYDNADDLIASDSVDVVIVAVRAPHHFELLQKIARAKKPVYSEWPSGTSLDETRRARDAFDEAGCAAFSGLQARSVPGVRYIRDLVTDGYVGRVLSTTLIGAAVPWGDVITEGNAYLEDDASGASMLTIPFGHSIDGICHVLGEVQTVTAQTTIQRPVVRIEGTDRTVAKTTPDQILVAAQLRGGIALSAHYRGGPTAGTTMHWEINGTDGAIVVTAPTSNLQLSPLTITGATKGESELRHLEIPAGYFRADAGLPYPALSVAQALLSVEDDLRDGTHTAPTFDDAVARKEMLDALCRASDTGVTQMVP